MRKPGLSFYTNIPTPYQLAFFAELSRLFELKVIYYAATESNRQWDFASHEKYQIITLKNNFIACFIQRWIIDFHFSWRIFSVVYKDTSEYVIVGGGYWIPNSVVALLFNKFKSKKIAYFSETLFPAKNRFSYAVKWLFLRILSLCCKAIFCIGKKAIESFEHFKVNVQKFVIVYNIDPRPFQYPDVNHLLNYKSRFKSNNEIIILSSGSLIERKGMDILIRAFKMIDIQHARLLIIGDGPDKSNLKELADNDKRIIFAGFQTPDQIPYFFAIADIFAFASRYDGWGVVINEAIAANLPIISSKQVGAAIEMIQSPENGILCDSDNVEQFKAAMEYLVLNTEKREAIKQNVENLVPFISSGFYADQVYNIFKYQLN